MRKRMLIPMILLIVIITSAIILAGCNNTVIKDIEIYSIDQTNKSNYDAKYSYMFDNILVDEADKVINKDRGLYLAHPDSVLLDNGSILTMYAEGHGAGATLMKRSDDGGLTWGDRLNTPRSWANSQETPTLYELNFIDGSNKLIMISGRPGWSSNPYIGGGFDVSLSDDNGSNWSEYENIYGPDATRSEYLRKAGMYNCIVAMASLTQLQDGNGNLTDQWMAIFHDYDFYVYKTILTFNSDGAMQWSEPTPIFTAYRAIESRVALCEPEVIRSPNGKQLCMLMRANTKLSNSYISLSNDEGITWSMPVEVADEVSGERHKAIYDNVSGKLVISMRNTTFKNNEKESKNFKSRGWTVWVGSYEDLIMGRSGDYVIKLAHTYIKGQKTEGELANADTGYAGIVQLADGTIVTNSYGRFSDRNSTYIVAKRFKLADIVSCFNIAK